MKPSDASNKLGAALQRDYAMGDMVELKQEFERPELQVKAFWSRTHEGFYVVTGFGFPCTVYVKHLDRWFGAENGMLSVMVQRKVTPPLGIEVVSPEVLTDIYRRGVAGLVKHRILGKVKG